MDGCVGRALVCARADAGRSRRAPARSLARPGNRKMLRCRTGPFATPFQDERDDLICKVLRRKELVTHVKVVGGGVKLGDKVGMHILVTRGPKDCELTLFNTIGKPVKTHVNGFGAFHLGATGCEAHRGGIVNMDCRWGLRVTKLGARDTRPWRL